MFGRSRDHAICVLAQTSYFYVSNWATVTCTGPLGARDVLSPPVHPAHILLPWPVLSVLKTVAGYYF